MSTANPSTMFCVSIHTYFYMERNLGGNGRIHEPYSSVSTVSGYGLDDRAIEVRFPAEMIFPLASVFRPVLGPTQPPVQWVQGVLSPGLKCGWGLPLTTHPHIVPRSIKSRSYTSSPPIDFVACSGMALALTEEHKKAIGIKKGVSLARIKNRE
jgi:hypothetical protein